MHHALIVARMAPESAPDIAKLFAASDNTDLPHLVGVKRRTLFQFGDVYLHLIESERPPGPEIAKVTEHPEFKAISDRLTAYRKRCRKLRESAPRALLRRSACPTSLGAS
ncbi:TcmI family type II polyketide cyclase, partial [Streptomyces sp. NPDC007107]|uniref:TcmI family type II polyketide cyclase n=1 Tax=Streptomyces sp. NPDC007107 TaxID=3156915 RepID=UPI0033E0C44D